MAKAAIRKLKERRFWRWLCVEVYGHDPAKHPPVAHCRRVPKFNKRKFKRACDRGWVKVQAVVDKYRLADADAASPAPVEADPKPE